MESASEKITDTFQPSLDRIGENPTLFSALFLIVILLLINIIFALRAARRKCKIENQPSR
jgi:hypothetical protein